MSKHYALEHKQQMCFCSTFLLTSLTVFIWLVGCAVIGYVSWVLATSVSVSRFLSGNLMFTYVVIGLGFLMFFTGFLGCIAITSRSNCLMKLYILIGVLCIATQIGGILTLTIMKLQMADLLRYGWTEVNQATRSIFQNKFDCCGYDGPKEFAYRNDVIDVSCYTIPTTVFSIRTTDNQTYWVTKNITGNESALQLKQEGCGSKLHRWVQDSRYIWVSVIVGIGLLELLSIIVASYVINNGNKRIQSRNSSEEKLSDVGT